MGELLGALFSGIVTFWGTNKQIDATNSANAKAEKYYNLERQDSLAISKANERIATEKNRINKLALQYQRDADLYGRKERGLERGMIARENKFAQTLSFLNANDQIRNNYVNIWRGGR